MSIPSKCQVLVIGGGPAGSYAAAALAREGLDVVVLEGDKFPRYHVGESMLPSIRHFLRFIDLDSTFDSHGFRIKNGAVFKLNKSRDPAFTDFLAMGGANAYSWNVVRSEADHIFFKHAKASGAQTFDGAKVSSLDFESPGNGIKGGTDPTNLGRATSAAWSKKEDGTSGKIDFDYLVDASGRFGLMCVKYLKNRKYNTGLKNMANWGYWKNVAPWGVGTKQEGCPYFEHLQDTSGWVWCIPLHDGTTSVGVVMKTDVASAKKKAMTDSSTKNFYLQSLEHEVPGIKKLLENATLANDDIHSGSDWSYSASSYSSFNVRIAGDAGCFIDPFLSSGVHLALMTGLSSATTIAASIRGDCDEETAMKWHTAKVQEVYTRFLVVVLSTTTQIRKGDELVIGDFDESGFDRAFASFRPVIQGTADVGQKISKDEVAKTLQFCAAALARPTEEQREHVLKKLEDNKIDVNTTKPQDSNSGLNHILTEDELKVLTAMRAREVARTEDFQNIDNFNTDVIDGLAANLQRGSLGLVRPAKKGTEGPENPNMGGMLKTSPEFGKDNLIHASELSQEDIKSEGIPMTA